MNPRIAVAGDRPQPLGSAIDAIAQSGEPTCLLWLIDLSAETSARRVRAELKSRYADMLAHAASLTALRHLIILCLHDESIAERKVHAAGAAFATRLHAELERARGRYVDVAVIDISACRDTRRLLDRVEEAADQPAGPAGSVALTWREIRDRTIHAAAAAAEY